VKLKRNIFINVILLLTSLLVSCAILEGFLRIYNPFEMRVRGDKIVLPVKRNYFYRNDYIPGPDNFITNKKNSLGFRGEEPPENFWQYLTIITVGGSTTECSFITDGKTWPDLLRDRLRKNFSHVWLNNAGFDGHSTFGHIVLMEDYIIKIKPKVALFLIGTNDFGIDDTTEYDNINIGRISFTSFKMMIKSLSAHSEFLSLGLNFYRLILARMGGLGTADVPINFNTSGRITLTEAYSEKIKRIHKDKYLRGYESRLIKLVHISKQNGIKPVLITQPMLWGDVVDSLTNINLATIKLDTDMNGKLAWELLELYNDITRRVGREEGILVIDLAKKMPKNLLYFYDDVHYTNQGARKVAEIIYEDLYPFLRTSRDEKVH